jgi:hypothetical protein
MPMHAAIGRRGRGSGRWRNCAGHRLSARAAKLSARSERRATSVTKHIFLPPAWSTWKARVKSSSEQDNFSTSVLGNRSQGTAEKIRKGANSDRNHGASVA